MLSRAQTLPEEVLTTIFNCTSESVCENGSRCFDAIMSNWHRAADHLSFSLVCKTWSKPALYSMYRIVDISSPYASYRFHASLQTNPAMASHVRHLQAFNWTDEECCSKDALSRLVDIMNLCNNLRCLGSEVSLGRHLARVGIRQPKHPEKVCLAGLSCDVDNHFGRASPLFDVYGVRVLHVYYSELDSPWTDFPLPNLESLTVDQTEMQVVDDKPFFTGLPKLKSFTIVGELVNTNSSMSTIPIFDRVFPSIGSKLTELTILDQTSLDLRDHHFQYLPNLVHLTYRLERFRTFAEGEECYSFENLPPTLKTLEFEWQSSCEQAIWFFKAFQSLRFLPKLIAPPILARTMLRYEGREREFQKEEDNAVESLLERKFARWFGQLATLGSIKPNIWEELNQAVTSSSSHSW